MTKQKSFSKNKKRAPQGLKRPKEDYTPLALELTWDKKDVRKEYSRLRSIWKKRYERLLKSDYSDINLVKDRPIARYKQLKDIETDRELYHLLSELATILSSRQSSVSGMKKYEQEKIEELNRTYGYFLNNHEDFMKFSSFMEKLRDFVGDRIYDSDFAVELYHQGSTLSNSKILELYDEFLKTGIRNINRLKSNVAIKRNMKRQQRKARKRKRRK